MIEKHAFGMFVPKGAKYLLLGSFTAKKKDTDVDYDWFYVTKRNQFWKIIEKVYDLNLSDKKLKINLFAKQKIAIADIILECERKDGNNLDSNLINIIYNDKELDTLLGQGDIKTIFFSSRFVEKIFNVKLKSIKNKFKDLEYITLPSPSPRYAAISFEEKLNFYKKVFPK